MQRVQKLISNAGFCSRRKAEALIAEGKVKVNGKLITLGNKAEVTDEITIDNIPLKKESKIYIILNKPIKTVCSLNPTSDYKPVTALINIKERVYPVGRLDVMTSGLLLLSNDGDFTNKITHPKHEIKKTYRIKINKPIASVHELLLQKGVTLEDGTTRPATIKAHSRTDISLTIHEGKNRIVRRMFKMLGYAITTLERTHIQNLGLGGLKPGQWRKLNEREVNTLLNASKS